MSVQTLQRVLWRLRERNPDTLEMTNNELRICIMLEVGTDQRTYRRARKALIRLHWIQCGSTKQRIRLTDNDLSDT